MTWELSFRKKLYKYLGMNADMQAYARARKRKEQECKHVYRKNTQAGDWIPNLTFIIEIQVKEWGAKWIQT